MSIVKFEKVTRHYAENPFALDEVSFDLPEDSVCGLLGRNGAGKSTFLKMIPALLHPSEGTVKVFGFDPWEQQIQVKKQIGYVSENDDLPGQLRIRDILDLCKSVYENWESGMAGNLLDKFSLDPKRFLSQLSKGQKRQVSLISALCHKPRLLILDEPAGGLDPIVRREFLEAVLNLLADSGSTILFSSHNLNDVERIANRIAILNNGKLLLHKEADDLKENICRVLLETDDIDKLKQNTHPALINVETKMNQVQATLLCAEDRAEELLQEIFKDEDAPRILELKSLNLEEIFVELAGERV